jgi:uncharacterized membrane protein
MATLSKTENKTLMQEARAALKGIWGLAVGTFFVVLLICIVAQMIPRIGWLVWLIIAGPISLGICIFSLAIARKKNPQFSQIFNGFQKFGVSLGAYLLMILFVILWMILLIIPGIIAALAYSMTFFIIAENDTIKPMDALKKSKEMMNGNKWKLFCLFLRFLGWIILSILTLGIGFLWLVPYMNVSLAKFYDDLLK